MQYIFIHGLGQNSTSWDKTISFMKNNFNPMCVDLFSLLNNKDTTYANMYNSFSDYCKNISEPLNLCGLSLGGVLALNYAIDNPERVKSLVLIAAQYKMPKEMLKFQNIIFRCMPKSVFAKMGLQKKDAIQLTNSMLDLDFTNKLTSISCPVLVACGEKDSANKKTAKFLSMNIPKAKFNLVENASHEVNIDNPQALAVILEDFYCSE